jgi:hypothetical protein
LPKDKIDAVHQRLEDNKTFDRGRGKNKYLLARMVLCDECGYAAFGTTRTGRKIQYYRHHKKRFDNKCYCENWSHIPAEGLENAVMVHLFKMYGDVSSMEKSMLRAIPDVSKINNLREQKKTLEGQLKKTERERLRLIKSIAKGIISDTDAEETIKGIRERANLLTEEIEKITPQIEKLLPKNISKRGPN